VGLSIRKLRRKSIFDVLSQQKGRTREKLKEGVPSFRERGKIRFGKVFNLSETGGRKKEPTTGRLLFKKKGRGKCARCTFTSGRDHWVE